MHDIKPTDRLQFELSCHRIDYNEEKLKNLKQEIAEKYNVPIKNIDIKFNPISIQDDGTNNYISENIIEDLQSKEFQTLLFEDYLKEKEITNVSLEDIKEIDNMITDTIDLDKYSKHKRYRIKGIKWSNYLSYGKDNSFDFTNLNGLVQLTGFPENQSGKTTFAIDLIRFALFGKSPKCPTLDSVFNVYLPEETEAYVELTLEIDNVDYVIKRVITRPALSRRTEKSKCKQTISYYKITNGNTYEEIETVNLEEESGTKTNNFIREAVGDVEDFNLVISATTQSLADLLHMGDTDKGKLFSRWLGLISIEEKELAAKKLWKEKYANSLLSNTYNRKTLSDEITSTEQTITEKQALIATKEQMAAEVDTLISGLNEEKETTIQQKKPVKESLLNTKMSSIEQKIEDVKNAGVLKNKEIDSLNNEISAIKDITFDNDLYKTLTKEVEDLNNQKLRYFSENGTIKADINNKRKEIERIEALIAKKICPNCGQPIQQDLQQKNIDAIEAECNTLVEKGVKNKAEIDALDALITQKSIEKDNILKNKDIVNKREKLELKVVALKSNLENLRNDYKNYASTLKELKENEEIIKANEALDIKVNNINISIKEKERQKQSLLSESASITGDVQYLSNDIKKKRSMIETLDKEEVLIRNWETYLNIVGKNGIIKIVLKRALPVINNEIKKLLDGLCDFEVELSINNKNNIVINMIRDGVSLEIGKAASGFEQTISALAIRTALSHLGNMPHPSFIVLDEILGGVGYENIDNIKKIYGRMLTSYEFIIHIVHDEIYADMHNQTITVAKNNNVSKIEF